MLEGLLVTVSHLNYDSTIIFHKFTSLMWTLGTDYFYFVSGNHIRECHFGPTLPTLKLDSINGHFLS